MEIEKTWEMTTKNHASFTHMSVMAHLMGTSTWKPLWATMLNVEIVNTRTKSKCSPERKCYVITEDGWNKIGHLVASEALQYWFSSAIHSSITLMWL